MNSILCDNRIESVILLYHLLFGVATSLTEQLMRNIFL